MERFEIENSREFKAAQELASALNDYGWNEKRFALATTTFHQTLQQTLFRTIVEILKVYADPQRRTDLRNEASKEGAKKLMEVLEELHIPFIWETVETYRNYIWGGYHNQRGVLLFLFTNILKQRKLCYTTNLKITKNSKTCLELSSMETGYAAERTGYCWHISGTRDYYMKQ